MNWSLIRRLFYFLRPAAQGEQQGRESTLRAAFLPAAPVADVVFVHGLGGSATGTWGFEPGTLNWSSWLSRDFPNVNIWAVDYPASPTAWLGHTMPLVVRAKNLLGLLSVYGVGERPVVFVAHSFGGLLVKQMLRLAQDDKLSFRKQVAGVLFLATPHGGAILASVARIFSVLQPSVTISELEASAPILLDLSDWFRKNVQATGVGVLYETTPYRGVMVVDAASADPGIATADVIAVDHDHISIAKLGSIAGVRYQFMRRFVYDVLTAAGIELAPLSRLLEHDIPPADPPRSPVGPPQIRSSARLDSMSKRRIGIAGAVATVLLLIGGLTWITFKAIGRSSRDANEVVTPTPRATATPTPAPRPPIPRPVPVVPSPVIIAKAERGTWIRPAGVTSVLIRACGGGGGGGGAGGATNGGFDNGGGGGGGAGALPIVRKLENLHAKSYHYEIGAGGGGGPGGAGGGGGNGTQGGKGGDTVFGSFVFPGAPGGGGGIGARRGGGGPFGNLTDNDGRGGAAGGGAGFSSGGRGGDPEQAGSAGAGWHDQAHPSQSREGGRGGRQVGKGGIDGGGGGGGGASLTEGGPGGDGGAINATAGGSPSNTASPRSPTGRGPCAGGGGGGANGEGDYPGENGGTGGDGWMEIIPLLPTAAGNRGH